MNILYLILGILLASSPLVALFIYISVQDSVKDALFVFGIAVGILAVVAFGIELVVLSGLLPAG